jgi:hypothetical protein
MLRRFTTSKTLEHAAEAQGFQATGHINRRLLRQLNAPASRRQPITTGTITWTPAN